MGTCLVGIILAAVVALIIRDMHKKRKNGGGGQCGGDCGHCSRCR